MPSSKKGKSIQQNNIAVHGEDDDFDFSQKNLNIAQNLASFVGFIIGWIVGQAMSKGSFFYALAGAVIGAVAGPVAVSQGRNPTRPAVKREETFDTDSSPEKSSYARMNILSSTNTHQASEAASAPVSQETLNFKRVQPGSDKLSTTPEHDVPGYKIS